MRLYEVASRFIDDLTLILRNQVGRADSKRASMPLSYEALSALLAKVGYGGINQASLIKIIDLHPPIQALIADHDEDGIELATTELEPDQGADKDAPYTGNAPSVQAMAKGSNPYK